MKGKGCLFSGLLSVVLCLSLITMTVFAETGVTDIEEDEALTKEEITQEDINENDESIPVAFLDTISEEDEDSNIVASGSCGDALNWTLDDEGTLTISGTGSMRNWTSESKTIWYDYHDSIKEIIIEDGVTTIGNYAFATCSELASISIPDSVVTIGDYSFCQTSSLTYIEMPDSISSIGNHAFYKTALTQLLLPSNISAMGANAFSSCDSLKSVTMSEGIEIIGRSAFSSCTNLEEVSLAESIKEIGQGAFTNCTSLTNVYIPSGSIGDHIFQNCTSLESVSLGKGVTAIGDQLFYSCSELQSLEVDSENPYFTSEDSVWFDKKQTKLIACPTLKAGEYKIPDSVVTVGDYAFYECKKLTSVTFGSSVESIQKRAFYRCDRLAAITLPDSIKTIEDYAFFDCGDLFNITVPANVETIGTCSLGYYQRYTDDNTYGELIDGFKIYGYTNSVAEEYALNNGITFESIGVVKRQISDCTVSLSKSEYTYNGSAKKPGITVKYKKVTLTSGTDYTVAYSNNVNAGTATVTITGKGNYTGSVKETYTIKKASQTLTAQAAKTSVVKGKTTKITASGKGTISYSTSKKSVAAVSSNGKVTAKGYGKATITVKAAGNSNYKSASKKITIKVIPKATSIKSVKNSKSKKATVKWKKVSGVTGYQIQYSTSKSFKNKKSVTVKGASKVSKTLSKLKTGKKYYIRIRSYKTVSGTKYYSSWSSKQSVKIKK